MQEGWGIFDGSLCKFSGIALDVFQKSTELNIVVPKPVDSKDTLFMLAVQSAAALLDVLLILFLMDSLRLCRAFQRELWKTKSTLGSSEETFHALLSSSAPFILLQSDPELPLNSSVTLFNNSAKYVHMAFH